MFSQKPKAIIFDWDNTLVNTMPALFLTFNRFMDKMKKPHLTMDEIKDNTRRPSQENLKRLFGDEWQKAKKIWIDVYSKNHTNNLVLMDYAKEIIEILHGLDIKLFVVSNKTTYLLRKEAEDLGIKDNFICLVGSDECEYSKPDAEIVEYVLEGTDINPKKDRVWFIGDGENDIECAINSNCIPVAFGRDFLNIKNHFKNRECPEIYHLENFGSLFDRIKASW